MNSKTIESARIAGAFKCIDVLRSANKGITSVMKMDESVADSFRKKDAILEEIMAAAGPLSPQAAGVLGVLADFALDSLQNGYSLQEQLDSDWQPETAMTAEEVRIARTAFADMYPDLCEAEKNVIPFPARSERRGSL